MIKTQVWLSRRQWETIRKAASADGLTPSQFIAKASFEYAKAILDRIRRPGSVGSRGSGSKAPARTCRPVAQRNRTSIVSRTGTSANV